MPGKMQYDFETALKMLLNAQNDIMILVQKWGEMLASTPQDVVFNLKGQDGPYTYSIPNIQKVIDTLNTRTLPPRPTFESVTLRGESGSGYLTNGGIEFSGAGAGSKYTANGIEHQVYEFDTDVTVAEWPLPRCWAIKPDKHPNITIAPSLNDTAPHAADFFIYAPGGSSVKLIFPDYGYTQRMELVAGSTTVWHIFMITKYVANVGMTTTARAAKMGITNYEEG